MDQGFHSTFNPGQNLSIKVAQLAWHLVYLLVYFPGASIIFVRLDNDWDNKKNPLKKVRSFIYSISHKDLGLVGG